MIGIAQQAVRAVAFDAFGTLIAFGATRTNPYQRLVNSKNGGSVARRPLLTRDVPVVRFASDNTSELYAQQEVLNSLHAG